MAELANQTWWIDHEFWNYMLQCVTVWNDVPSNRYKKGGFTVSNSSFQQQVCSFKAFIIFKGQKKCTYFLSF